MPAQLCTNGPLCPHCEEVRTYRTDEKGQTICFDCEERLKNTPICPFDKTLMSARTFDENEYFHCPKCDICLLTGKVLSMLIMQKDNDSRTGRSSGSGTNVFAAGLATGIFGGTQ